MMRQTKLTIGLAIGLLIIISAISYGFKNNQMQKEPWTEKQLMEPDELAKILNSPSEEAPVIFSIGPAGLIRNAIDIGEATKENLEKLKKEISSFPKDKNIVLYCGCCPFDVCPNIRPTFELLNELGFTNHRLLNLPDNLKVDWIDHEYPMDDE